MTFQWKEIRHLTDYGVVSYFAVVANVIDVEIKPGFMGPGYRVIINGRRISGPSFDEAGDAKAFAVTILRRICQTALVELSDEQPKDQ